MKYHKIALGLLVAVLCLATIATASLFDPIGFLTTSLTAETKISSELTIISTNPSLGSTAAFYFEFETEFEITNKHRFLLNLPWLRPNGDARARVCECDSNGNPIQQGLWSGYDQIGGSHYGLENIADDDDLTFIDRISDRNAGFDPSYVLVKSNLRIGVKKRVRIELAGFAAPPLFDRFGPECLAAFNAADVSALTVQDRSCCKQFTLVVYVEAGATLLSPVLSLSGFGSALLKLEGKLCPNYGNQNSCSPECTTVTNWERRHVEHCCQYNQFNTDPRCKEFICKSKKTWSFAICGCDYVNPNGTLISTCPQCSNANFPIATCCDRWSNNGANKPIFDTNPLCDSIACACEDGWTKERCCHRSCGAESSYSLSRQNECPSCASRLDLIANPSVCCQSRRWWGDVVCICDTSSAETYNVDICCQDRTTASPRFCPIDPIDPEECSSGCGCDEEGSCPCAFFANGNMAPVAVDENGTPIGGHGHHVENTYVRYDKHNMDVNNVTSGHNTILINHLHIDTHIDLQDEADVTTLKELLPAIMLSVSSGGDGECNGPLDLVNQIKDGIKDDLKTINDAVKTVKSDVKDVVTTVVTQTGNVVKDVIKDATTNGGNIVSALLGRPTRSTCRVYRKTPLNAVELVSLRLFIVAQLAASGNLPGCNVNFISQVAFGAGAIVNVGKNNAAAAAAAVSGSSEDQQGYAITYEVSQTQTEQNVMTDKLNALTSSLGDKAAPILGADKVEFTTAQAVAGANECVVGTCSASCQCEANHPCSKDEDCLSGKCTNKICASSNTASTMITTTASIAVIVVAVLGSFMF